MPRRKNVPTDPIDEEKLRTKVFEHIRDGNTFSSASDKFNISRMVAVALYNETMEQYKVPAETIQEWRILENQRIDVMMAPIMELAQKSGLSAKEYALLANAYARLSKRRASMMGIDKPTKIDVTHHLPTQDRELAARRQRTRLQDAGFAEISTEPPKHVKALITDGNNGNPQEES